MNILSNKVFAKQNKHRGLQKLKYYCEMCSRQCKDENGFKCHTQSEQHKRNMELFTSNPKVFIEKFSYEFEKGFLDLLRMHFSTKKVLANQVYKDFINDKDHTHMNSTKWTTLGGFLNYLKSTGKITMEETDKGPLIAFIDNSPQGIEQRKNEEKRLKEELQEAKRRKEEAEKMAELIEKNKREGKDNEEKIIQIEKLPDAIEIDKEYKINLDIKGITKNKEANVFQNSNFSEKNLNPEKELVSNLLSRKKQGSNLDKLFKLSESKEETQKSIHKIKTKTEQPKIVISPFDSEDPWVKPGLIVRIKDANLGKGELFNKKAKIIQVLDDFVAEIETLDSATRLKIDQTNLEQVIPALGSKVMILYGQNKWKIGKLEEINGKEGFVKVTFDDQLLYLAVKGICKI